MVLSLATTFTSCSNDDDEDIPVYSLKDVEGNYLGKMTTESAPVIPTENAGESEEPVGIEVNAEVKDNEIAINKFPVDDLIKVSSKIRTKLKLLLKLSEISITKFPTQLLSTKTKITSYFNFNPNL